MGWYSPRNSYNVRTDYRRVSPWIRRIMVNVSQEIFTSLSKVCMLSRGAPGFSGNVGFSCTIGSKSRTSTKNKLKK